jgi:phosphoenolpyruvate-protein kinase (PTS system EI component)
VLAVDRMHGLLGASLDSLHPAVLRLIGAVCEAGRSAGRPVAVCGGVASDPGAAPILVGLGVQELSAVPGSIPAVKDAVRRQTLPECRALAEQAVALDSAREVRALLADAIEESSA